MKKFSSVILAILLTFSLVLSVSASSDLPYVTSSEDNVLKTYAVPTGGSNTRKITVTVLPKEAIEVYTLLNAERTKVGLEPLLWNEDLLSPAMLRAVELTISQSHNRPDGSSYYDSLDEYGFGDSQKYWTGENLAYGYNNPRELMVGWMKSSGHKANILKEQYTSVGIGAVEKDGKKYWIQLFTSSDQFDCYTQEELKGRIGNSVTSGVTPVKPKADTPPATVAHTTRTPIDVDHVSESLKLAIGSGEKSIKAVRNASLINASGLTKLNELNNLYKEHKINVYIPIDTYNNLTFEGRMSLELANLPKTKDTFKLGVFTRKDYTDSTKKYFEKYFKNNISVVAIEQEGNLGTTLKITAAVNLDKLNTKNLVFYTYDKTAKTYLPIKSPNYSVSKDGLLTFYTSIGGDIVITDSALAKK